MMPFGREKSDNTYFSTGFARGFVMNIADYFRKPRKQGIDPQSPPVQSVGETHRTPNIIAVLAESFFDITRVDGLELSEDPIPFFRSLKSRAVGGTLFVTPFG